MSDSKELVFNIDENSVEKVFSTENGLQPYLDDAKKSIEAMLAECGDVATAKGRAAYKSLARKVASFRIRIDDIGKDLVAELKEKPKKIDAERKRMRDMLDEWKADIIKPVEDWEEKERLEAEIKAAELAALELAKQIETDHEFALLLNAEFDRKRAEQIAQAEAERIANEKRIAEEAAAAAIAAERAESERKAREAQEAIEAAERARIKAEQDAEAAKLKAAQYAENVRLKAARDQEAAVEAERQRQAAEAARITREEEARAANIEHQRNVNREIIEAFAFIGEGEEFARLVIIAVLKAKSPRITINY